MTLSAKAASDLAPSAAGHWAPASELPFQSLHGSGIDLPLQWANQRAFDGERILGRGSGVLDSFGLDSAFTCRL